MTSELIRPEDGPNFRSYTDATWRDVCDVEHTRYIIRPMKPGRGLEVIDTKNNANWSVVSDFQTEADAREWMRTNRAP
jgi:hypothetical protein